jgi:hypothetical protein
LDESLILAILIERDITTLNEYEETRAILLTLAESAAAEKATGFDPSGTGCQEDSESQPASTSRTDLTEDTTTSHSEHSECEAAPFTHRVNLGEAEKIDGLRDIFSNFKDHTIRFVLRSCDWDLDRAFDELLTRQTLEESGSLPKGVDGFLSTDHDWGPKEPQQKGRRSKSDKGKRAVPVPVHYRVVSPTINDSELEGGGAEPAPTSKSRRLLSRSEPIGKIAASSKLPSMDHFESQTPRPERPKTAMPNLAASRSLRGQAAAVSRLGPLGRQGAAFGMSNPSCFHRVLANMSF